MQGLLDDLELTQAKIKESRAEIIGKIDAIIADLSSSRDNISQVGLTKIISTL
jgi:hypothetical protein